MTSLRVAVIVLIFANMLALAIWKGWLGASVSQGEPERLSNQLNPERIRLSSEARPPQPPRPRSAPPPAAEEPAPPREPVKPAVEPRAEVKAPPACVAFGALTADQARELAARVAKAGEGYRITEGRSETPSSWWVHIPSQGSKENAERKVTEVRHLGVEDLFIVQDAGPNQFAISLGLFKNEAAASRQLESLKSKGVRSAQIATRGGGTPRVEVRGPSDGLATLASEMSERLKGAGRFGCNP